MSPIGRIIRHRLVEWTENIPARPLFWLYAYGLRKANGVFVDGVKLIDMSFDDSDDEAFLRVTQDALKMIETLDPRRYARIRREARYIVNGELDAGGTYSRRFRAIDVDFGRYHVYPDKPDYTWSCSVRFGARARGNARALGRDVIPLYQGNQGEN